ncbi:MAG: cytochrome c3 family protein [Thermoanaerobaculia bacterium]
MSQLFSRWTNLFSRSALVLVAVAPVVFVALGWEIYMSSWTTRVGRPIDQPIPFSHKHHVSEDGIDCRYCHTSVEKSSFAGIPPIKTCMTCHSQLYVNSPMLAPIRKSFESGIPVEWNRVNHLPEFVFFDHSIHVAKGVGCSTCHGRVDQMPITWKTHSFFMRWCLDCHTHPERYLRPRSKIFDMTWEPPPNQIALGKRLIEKYGINVKQMTDCTMCHR